MDSRLEAVRAAEDACGCLAPRSPGGAEPQAPETDASHAPDVPAARSSAPSGCHSRQSGRFHPRLASYVAFLVAVFVCMVAAATVASQDIPLMLGGY